MDYAPVYDPGYYLSRNDDVEKAYTKTTYGGVTLLDDSAVLRHFINHGMAEGRRGSESFPTFMAIKLVIWDLRKAFGNNLKAYYTHYLKYGLKEGRDGSSMTGFEGLYYVSRFSSYEDAAVHYLRTVGSRPIRNLFIKQRGCHS